MASHFFDTSAIVKYFHPEEGSDSVERLFDEAGRRILLSTLGVVEVQSALAVKVRTGALTIEGAQAARGQLMLNLAAGDIEAYTVDSYHFRQAERLIGRHAFQDRLRALDALQLAVAIDLADQGEADTFVVADSTLSRIARVEGLNVIVP